MSQPVRCHHCGSTWIGDSAESLVFVGMFKDPQDRDLIAGPRTVYRCKRCAWVNVFQSQANAVMRDYRHIEVKGDRAA